MCAYSKFNFQLTKEWQLTVDEVVDVDQLKQDIVNMLYYEPDRANEFGEHTVEECEEGEPVH